MLKLFASLARVIFGFALASFAAGLVMVLFVNTPAEVLAQPASRLPETASATFDLALLTATHAAIFAVAFVLIVAGLGEWFSIRALSFYLIAGLAIALLGFSAQYSSEVAGQPTVLNNYALKAFITSGFFAGFVYWLASGQFAGKPPEDESIAEPVTANETTEIAEPSNDVETSAAIKDTDADAEPKKRYASLLSRLKLQKRSDAEQPPDGKPASLDEATSSLEETTASPDRPSATDTDKPDDENS